MNGDTIDPLVHQGSAAPKEFEARLRENLRSAPWLLVSLCAHAAAFLLAAQFDYTATRSAPPAVTISAILDSPVVDPLEPPPEVRPREEPIEEPTEPIDEPVVTETVDAPNETETEAEDARIDAPFEGKSDNAIIGCFGDAGGQKGGKFGGRFRTHGKPSTEVTVGRGLEWLARHQHTAGFWSCAEFSKSCEKNRCDGAGHPTMDVGVTGLSLLAFLGAGNTPSSGKYKTTVKKGLKWLIDHQDRETGLFGERDSHQGFLYDHALATLAMCEGYGLSKWPQLKEPAQQGVRFIEAARNPQKAWRYAYPPNADNDLSVTGFMVLALKSAQDFGLEVDKQALSEVAVWIDSMTDENTWRAGYLTKGGLSAREPGMADRWPESKTEAMTAVSMLCRIFLGEDPDRSPALRGGADLLRKRLPEWNEEEGTIDMYYWYYGSYAMYQMGGKDWDVWQGRMLDAIVKRQRQDGDEAGSWDPQFDPWGHQGGRVYSTAIMTLCLEVYYRYDRVFGGGWNLPPEPPRPR